MDKYRLENGNVGLIIDQDGTHNRYHVQFRDDYRTRSCVENLFGLLKDPFSGKTEHLDRLVNKGDYIELTARYSRGPFRETYRLHSVSRDREPYKSPRRIISLPYRSIQAQRY